MKIVTAFTHMMTNEGHRIGFTYSEVDENGNLISQNNKGNYVAMKPAIVKAIQEIESDIVDNHLSE